MKATTLEVTQSNYTFKLKKVLEQVAAGTTSEVQYFMAVFSYRVLAICNLLLDADQSEFAGKLFKAAQARLFFLSQVRRGWTATPKFVCTSKNVGFTSALACGDIELARDIADVSLTTHFEGIEYEEDFSFFHFLQRFVLDPGDEAELEAILDRWEAALEGQDSGYLNACRGLLSNDPGEFEQGFASLIVERQEELDDYKERISFDEELFVAEGQVFIEGLAVLRLAELQGLPTQEEYELIPRLSRVPMGADLPEAEAWREEPEE